MHEKQCYANLYLSHNEFCICNWVLSLYEPNFFFKYKFPLNKDKYKYRVLTSHEQETGPETKLTKLKGTTTKFGNLLLMAMKILCIHKIYEIDYLLPQERNLSWFLVKLKIYIVG